VRTARFLEIEFQFDLTSKVRTTTVQSPGNLKGMQERMESESPLHERLAAIAGSRTYRAVAELTGTNSETVRRYMQGQTPSVEFLAALCNAFKINGEWLLCGRGPMKAEDVKSHALRSATGPELLTALVAAIERLTDRMDRIEVFVQLLDSRLRGRENLAAAQTKPAALPPSERPDEQATPAAVETPTGRERRARRVADAIPPRTPPATPTSVSQRSRKDAD
jgi:transcriptional regulator with XRE-family HTH domain